MIATEVTSSPAFVVLEIVGILAFSVSGVMAAARARMDWLGAIVLALVVATGGGTLRDLLLGRLPVTWLERSWPVIVAMGMAVAMLMIVRLWPHAHLDATRPILIADAAGLSAFTVLGTQIGLDAELSPFLAVMLGVLTGVGGGVLRDLLTGNPPTVLFGQVYAVAGIVGASVFVLMLEIGIGVPVTVWISVAVVFVIRLLAMWRDWHLPRVLPAHDDA